MRIILAATKYAQVAWPNVSCPVFVGCVQALGFYFAVRVTGGEGVWQPGHHDFFLDSHYSSHVALGTHKWTLKRVLVFFVSLFIFVLLFEEGTEKECRKSCCSPW